MSNTTLKKALCLIGLSIMSTTLMAEPVPVELQKTDDGWQLLRGGEPYFIHGAGGDGPLDQLAAAGANSIREVIAFPKTQTAHCPLTDAPSTADNRQLVELGIRLRQQEKSEAAASES